MLDQGQTITVNAVPRVYNLVVFDGLKTERQCTLEDNTQSLLKIDHTKAKDALSANRHLVQLVSECNGEDPGQLGFRTINITLSQPKWADAANAGYEFAALSAFVQSNLARILGFES